MGAMGQGPGRFPALFVCWRVRCFFAFLRHLVRFSRGVSCWRGKKSLVAHERIDTQYLYRIYTVSIPYLYRMGNSSRHVAADSPTLI